MLSLKQLRQSKAARNAAASYLAFVSTSICGLVSIPIAVAYLSKAQMGLWTIIFTIVGYLLWLDLGIGNATGRKIADAMAKNDAGEINRWWSLSIGVLSLLGLLLIVVAIAISPFISGWLHLPAEQIPDTLWLFIGLALVSALSMPFRAYPGLLVALERFHWVPLVQALMPWIQLGGFWSLLHLGFGVRSYLPALMVSQMVGWAIFAWQVHGHGLRIQLDFSGWTKARFHELFSYSGSLAVAGISASIIQSLPALLLTRLGGLPVVPVYNLSNRGPGMLNSLASRSTHAFYPNLQRLYVTGEHERFHQKYRQINQLGIWSSLIAAGAVLAGNRTLVCWLAKEDFFAGSWTNLWFACAVVVLPFVNGIGDLLQYSGKMGKSAIFALLELPLGAALCWGGYRWAGLPGLAAAFAFLPLLVRAPYFLTSGPAYCGYQTWSLCGNAILTFGIVISIVIGAGLWVGSQDEIPASFEFLGRVTFLPTWRELMIGCLLAIAGSILSFRCLLRIRAV